MSLGERTFFRTSVDRENASAIVYSFVPIANANNFDILKYFEVLLQRMLDYKNEPKAFEPCFHGLWKCSRNVINQPVGVVVRISSFQSEYSCTTVLQFRNAEYQRSGRGYWH